MDEHIASRLGKHGTLTAYTVYKCRCESCRAVWRQYQAEYHQRHKEKLLAQSAENYARSKAQRLVRKKERYETQEGRRRASRDVSTRRARQLGKFVEVVDRATLLDRCNGICAICGEAIDPKLVALWLDGRSPRTARCPSTDHIVPLSRGGKHSYANCQLAHFSCNLKKHARI